MPSYPKHPCAHPLCAQLVERGKARCPEHTKKEEQHSEMLRGTAHERGYDNRWKKSRERYLRENPLCVNCRKHGRVTPARVVDHIIDHEGDQALFWDEKNWQSLCDYTSPFNCHGSKTAKKANAHGR